jgi:lipopolysaccharide transport system permease protein
MNQPATTAEHWDIEIKPQLSFFDLNVRELWRYRDLLVLFVRRDFVAQYKQTVLGPVWHIVQPALTTLTFLLIFHSIAGIDTDGVQPVLFYMSGITIWNYFSTCLTATSNTFVANAHIFGKVYFPRLVLPLSVVLSNMVKLGIQFGLLVLVMGWFALFRQVPLVAGWHNLLLPLIVLLMAGMGLGLGIIISSLTTKYRDFTVLISFAVQLLMYATPVAYPLSFLSGTKYGWLIAWNPLSAVVEGFRYALFHTGSFQPLSLAYSAGFMVLVLVVGVLLFSKVERTFMDTV